MRTRGLKLTAFCLFLIVLAWSPLAQSSVVFVSRIVFGTATSGVTIRSSTGTPEAAVTAPIGSMFLRSDGGAGTAVYVKESGSGNTGWVTLPGATVTASSSNTFTNKTIDAEGTGNLITIPFHNFIRAAECEIGSAYMPSFDSASAGAGPASACVIGANVTFGQADFTDTGTRSFESHLFLPSDWTGTIDANFGWKTAATSGNVVWQIKTICIANDESVDPAWNTASTVTDAALGTANRFNVASITGVTITGCAAGEWLHFQVLRDPANVSDTLGATASLVYVDLVYRRAM